MTFDTMTRLIKRVTFELGEINAIYHTCRQRDAAY
jgi:hypothetical protein